MAQITSYGSGRVTEANKRAAAERAKERARIAEARRREDLLAAGEGMLAEAAIDLAIQAEQDIAPPDPAKLAAEAEERRILREADEKRLSELVKKHKRRTKTFYRQMENMLAGVEADKILADESRALSAKLQVNDPISTTVMGVGNGVGWVADRGVFVTVLLEKFLYHYKRNGAQIIPEKFEIGI